MPGSGGAQAVKDEVPPSARRHAHQEGFDLHARVTSTRERQTSGNRSNASYRQLSRMTSRWFRGSDARTRRPDGKGLGLAIATGSVRRLDLTLAFHRPGATGLRAEIRSSSLASTISSA